MVDFLKHEEPRQRRGQIEDSVKTRLVGKRIL